MNWLNPVNWVKAGVASTACAKVDEYVNAEDAMALARQGVNYVSQAALSNVKDETLEKTANGLIIAGEALTALGNAIKPNGDGGKTITSAEFFDICDKLEAAFGDICPEDKIAELRTWLKGKIRETLGVA